MPNARLAAVYGNRLDRAQAFAAEYGAHAYDDYAAMLADPCVDAVCVLTPSGTHAKLGVAAAEAGKHVVVEKPIDVTLEGADRLIEACRRAGVKLCVISQHRYDHAFMELKQAIDAGLLGLSARRMRRSPITPIGANWKISRLRSVKIANRR